jgi:hypothetical protein
METLTHYPVLVFAVASVSLSLSCRPWTGCSTADACCLLVFPGMNDVINSQGYTQAAYWNRIPIATWYLMAATNRVTPWNAAIASRKNSPC